MNGDLWIYGIHSNNAEMIHILEENQIFPKNRTYEGCMVESIKCHHNEIFNYIKDVLFDRSKWRENNFEDDYYDGLYDELRLNKMPLFYHNFELIQNDFESIFKLIFYLNQYEYSSLVKFVNDQTNFFFNNNDYKHDKRCIFAEDSYFVEYIVEEKKYIKKVFDKNIEKYKLC